MLKLIEIRSTAMAYDIEAKTCKSSYSLKEVYLNPDHIIMMRENDSLCGKARRGLLLDGMDENMSFTELTISTPGHMSKTINIVGSPESIFEGKRRSS